jgi:hypothetical protein
MKNYVVWTNCAVNESDDTVTKWNLAPVNNDTARNGYSQINKISRDSAKKYLQGTWEEIVYTDPAPSRTAIFQRNWQRIHDLWHKEPCNILYLDSDTIIIRPTEIFDRFAEFRVFNWTDPKFNEKFENLYNAGVRYYPATMSRDLWTVGNEMAKNWDLDNWNQEQEIFNTMFWQQHVSDPHHPELNWQGMILHQRSHQAVDLLNQWNALPIDNAHIIHVHGSRNIEETVNVMSIFAKNAGIYN